MHIRTQELANTTRIEWIYLTQQEEIQNHCWYSICSLNVRDHIIIALFLVNQPFAELFIQRPQPLSPQLLYISLIYKLCSLYLHSISMRCDFTTTTTTAILYLFLGVQKLVHLFLFLTK